MRGMLPTPRFGLHPTEQRRLSPSLLQNIVKLVEAISQKIGTVKMTGLPDATDCEAAVSMVGIGAKIGVIGESGTPVGTDAAAGMKSEVVNPSRLRGTNPPSGCETTT